MRCRRLRAFPRSPWAGAAVLGVLAGCSTGVAPASADAGGGDARQGDARTADARTADARTADAGAMADARTADARTPDAGTPDAGAPGPTTEYAPYFYTWGWGDRSYAFTSLVEMQAKGGPAAVTLAFVLSGNGCNASTDIQDHLDDVRAYVAAGGHLKASFGGADGTYLEYACSTAGALAGALARFVDDTGITDLDFDLEQGSRSSNVALNRMRAAALKQAQDEKHIRVAFTLPVGPGGLEQGSIDIVKAALDAGVSIAFVNGMTMDYGDGTDLGTTPIQSVDAVARQVRGLLPALSLDQAYRMVGATAMIGKNDDAETFSQGNASTLIDHARATRLGLVSFWAIQRDQKCPAAGNDLGLCSRVNGATFEFNDIFAAVNGTP
jgi:chitinase